MQDANAGFLFRVIKRLQIRARAHAPRGVGELGPLAPGARGKGGRGRPTTCTDCLACPRVPFCSLPTRTVRTPGPKAWSLPEGTFAGMPAALPTEIVGGRRLTFRGWGPVTGMAATKVRARCLLRPVGGEAVGPGSAWTRRESPGSRTGWGSLQDPDAVLPRACPLARSETRFQVVWSRAGRFGAASVSSRRAGQAQPCPRVTGLATPKGQFRRERLLTLTEVLTAWTSRF